MNRKLLSAALLLGVASAVAVQSFAAADKAAAKEKEAKLLAVLKSDAPQHEKAAACRELGVYGSADAVPVLAGMLGDEKMSHMARYALEPNPSPAVDQALRDALGQVKGRPQLGVIGSLGVRKDAKAVGPLSELLGSADADTAQAAARALGKIGTADAAKAIQTALPKTAEGNVVAFCEGLFRCAEALAAKGQKDQATALYDQLRAMKGPHQAITGGIRGAILVRGKDGVKLLSEYLASKDYLPFAAACHTAIDLREKEVTAALVAAMKGLPADNQVLVLQTLGVRGEASAVPAVTAAAKSGDKPVRLAAIRALGEIGDPASAPVLTDLSKDGDGELAGAAKKALSSLPAK